MSKQTAKIDNWTLTRVRGELYLLGVITDHPQQDTFMTQMQMTSRVINFDRAENTAETQNTLYTLGAPAPETKEQTDVE